MSEETQTEKDIKEIKDLLGNKNEKVQTPIISREKPLDNNTPLSKESDAVKTQADYEKRMDELTKREQAIDQKITKMESLNTQIQSEGLAMSSTPQEKTEKEKQKDQLMESFGGCIDGLEKII
ncbi:hypothetical protein GQ473_04075 [archaeon]|nr:hypothetical protein [archaeon]